MRDAVEVREFDQRLGDVLPLQHARLDVQVAREVQMMLHRLAIASGHVVQVDFARYRHGETVGMQIVRHAFAAANQHRGGRLGRHQNQDAVACWRTAGSASS